LYRIMKNSLYSHGKIWRNVIFPRNSSSVNILSLDRYKHAWTSPKGCNCIVAIKAQHSVDWSRYSCVCGSSKTCYERIFNIWYYHAIDMYIHLSVIYVFFFDFTEKYFQYQRTYHDTKTGNIGQCDVKYIMTLPIKQQR